jgi:hypothetical protein
MMTGCPSAGRQFVAEPARQDVGRSASRKWHDLPDRFRWIRLLRLRDLPSQRHDRDACQRKNSICLHVAIPIDSLHGQQHGVNRRVHPRL